jgi:microcystin-dependent protein
MRAHLEGISMHKLLVASAAMLAAGISAAHAQTPDSTYTGTIYTTANTFCPRDTMPAQGQILPVVKYPALFSLVGATYGGDGRDTFGIPDMRGRSAVGAGLGPGLTKVTLGEMAGDEIVSIDAPLLSHTHSAKVVGPASATASLMASSERPTTGIAYGNYLPTFPPFTPTYATAPGTLTEMGPGSVEVSIAGAMVDVQSASSGDPEMKIPVRSPFVGLTFCIVVDGVYPPRT